MTEPIKEPTEPGWYLYRACGRTRVIRRTERGGWHMPSHAGSMSWERFVRFDSPDAIERVVPSWERAASDPGEDLYQAERAFIEAMAQPPLPVPPHPSGPQGDVIDTICGRPGR